MDCESNSNNDDKIFDLFLRKKNKLDSYDWEKIDESESILKEEAITEGILIESQDVNHKIPNFYRLYEGKLVKYKVLLFRIKLPLILIHF